MNIKWEIAQYLEIRWWNRYLKNKTANDYLKWKKDYWKGFLQQIQLGNELLENKNILDAGCGPTGIFCLLDSLGCSITAIDPLFGKYRDLQHFRPGKYQNTRFLKVGLEEFRDEGGFDLIFCLNVINHVRSLDKAIGNLYKLLKPGGQLIISMDVHRFLLFKKILQLLPLDIMHPHQFGLREYRCMLEDAGFNILQNIGIKKSRIFNYHCIVAIKNPEENSSGSI
jgi:2-polyprenyl-3-methyl-5-hydroxy-6-metoxy-1,4-benzoquinol methylase